MTWEGKWICVKYIYWHNAVHLLKITLIYRTLPEELHRKREIPCLFFVHLILKDIISHGVIMKAIFGTKNMSVEESFLYIPIVQCTWRIIYYWSSFIGPITQALKTFNCTELSCSYRVLQLVLWILGSYCLCI